MVFFKNVGKGMGMATVLRAAFLVCGLSLAQAAQAAVSMGMVSSGSPTFDAAAGPGKDTTGTDAIIRTNDYATYVVGYTQPAGTNNLVTLQAGATTLPPTYAGPALPQLAYFSVTDLPTGAGGCQNIQATAISAAQAATGKSGVSADGQTLFCAQPGSFNASNLNFRMRIGGAAANGATIDPPTVTFSSSSTPAGSPVTTLNDGATTFGLPTLTVSATPRWNLAKTNFQNAVFVPGSGPGGEDGYVFGWNLGVYAIGSRKGLEAINGAYTIDESFNDPDFPNAQLVNWKINPSSYNTNIDFSAAGQNGCGDWRQALNLLGLYLDNSYYYPNDKGTAVNNTVAYQVAKGGTCDATVVNNVAKTATLTLNNTDFSLAFYPTKAGSNPAAATLVNVADLDSATNQWWVASKSVAIWVPLSDFPAAPVPNTKSLTNQATLSAISVTGQANVDPNSADDISTKSATYQIAGSINKKHSTWKRTNPFGLPLAPSDPAITNDAHVNQAAPGQLLDAYLNLTNASPIALPAGYICDKIDNTRFTYFDATAAAYTAISGTTKDPLTGINFLLLRGTPTPVTWQLGVGGTGIAGGTWLTYNTVANEYVDPSTAGAAQATSGCTDADATWYNSVADVVAALGATGLQQITRVRGSYASFPAAGQLLVYVPQQVNANYTYSSTDNAPGGAFAAGNSTLGAMAVNQMQWIANQAPITQPMKSSDAVRIFQTEYAQVTKSSSTHPANTLVTVGSIVNYKLVVNLTTGGSPHTADVTVWDVLPNYLSYVPGSSTFGGSGLGDPVCASAGLPPALFPAALPAGAAACVWTIPAQSVTATAIGNAAGNLPALNFDAVVSLAAPNNTNLLNSSFATSTGDLNPKPSYNSAGSSFVCAAGQNCKFSNHLLQVALSPGMSLNKRASKALVPLNTGFSYTLNYAAIGANLASPRLIDVLPYTGDGRSPASNYAGALKLTAPIVVPVASAGPPATVADLALVVLYTSNAPGNIIRKPMDASHDITGAGTNTAASTNWCTVAQFGSANCPANIGAATAFMAFPLGGGAVSLLAGDNYALVVDVKPTGNVQGNVYSNDFVADSSSLGVHNPGSSVASTTVVAPDLIISKSASPTTVVAGQSTVFTLTAANNVGASVGPIEAVPGTAITVTDPLPAGLNLVGVPSGTNWDCSASAASNVSCTYTGPLPIGVGSTVGGAISFTAQVPLAAAAGNVTNTASVAMAGQGESPAINNSGAATIATSVAPGDMTSTVSCTPASATAPIPGQSVVCTAKCKNTGPGVALAATCGFNGALPAGAVNTCAVPASSAALALNAELSCQLTFPAPASGGAPIAINAGGGASNDPIGGADRTAAVNNTSKTTVTVAAPSDMVSTVSCLPVSPTVGTLVTCTAKCTNNGPSAAANATCQFNGALPAGLVSNSCAVPATSASLNNGLDLTCTLTFKPVAAGALTLRSGGGAANDSNGANDPTAGNNPNTTLVNAVADAGSATGVPTLNEWMLALLALMLVLGPRAVGRRLPW